MKVPLIGPSGKGRILGANSRRAVNFYLESDDAGGKEPIVWVGRPGLKLWAATAAVVRGWLNWSDSLLYYVAGNKLYSMTTAGVATERGTLSTSTGDVDLQRNRTELLITDGSAGQYYVWNTLRSEFATVTKWSAVTAITTATRSGLTVTITATAHGGETGNAAKVWGMDHPEYNTAADVSITKTGANTFTYALTMANLTALEVASITRSGLTATATTDLNHGYASSDDVLIAGATYASWNGTPNITVTGDKTFTFPYVLASTVELDHITNSAGTAFAVTKTAHGFTNGEHYIADSTSDYNGTQTITVTGPDAFTFSCDPMAGDDSPSSGTIGRLPDNEATTAAQVGKLPKSPDGGIDGKVAIRIDTLTIQPQRCAQMDGYGILQNAATNTTEGIHPGQFYTTAPDDFGTVRASSLQVAQRDPDAMLVPVSPETGGHLYLLGEYSCEVFYNAGNSEEVPFEAIRTAAIPWGIIAPWTAQPLGDGMAWLGRQKRGPVTLFMLESGYKPAEFASKAVADWLASASLANLQAAYAMSWAERGHDFYLLTVGSESKLYDYTESKKVGFPCWSDWTSYNGISYAQARGKRHVFFNNKHLFADHTYPQILEMDYSTVTDLEDATARAIQRLGVSGYVFSEDKSLFHSRVFLDMEPAGATGSMLLESSDDKGTTWVSHGSKDFAATATRLEWTDLGSSQTDRLYRITTTSAAKIVILGMWADIEDG